ncbi:carbon storage regulator CsrA [Fusibacter sp. JL216-2]|uniref:carbon storage regulator CsrA n=1 Tax=Fusibacter sp. JL216-2 TaxID=3071453 RepID=UPI003D34811A
MLILSRKKNESIVIDGKIEIQVIDIGDGRVRIGIDAPKSMEIHRKEIYEKINEENEMAAKSRQSLRNLETYVKSKK